MSEPFKTAVEPSVEPQEARREPTPLISDELQGNEVKASEELTVEEHNLDIWEGLHKREFGTDYFNIKNTVSEFPLSVEFKSIDKFIKAEMQAQDMEMNTQNYEQFISDLEDEIGTTQTETYKRINKIFQYIKTLRKYREIKEKKNAYLNSTE